MSADNTFQMHDGQRTSDKAHTAQPWLLGHLGGTLTRLLVQGPSVEEVARLLVAILRAPIGAQGVRVAIGQSSVGLSALDVSEGTRLMVAADHIGEAGMEASGSYPCELAAIPLGGQIAPVGSLAVSLASPLPRLQVLTCLHEIASPLAIYAAGWLSSTQDTDGHARSKATPTDLTSRQMAVLEGLAQGMTMAQISMRLGYSTSTIRSDSLAIYRYLRVHGRDEAVIRAQECGLIRIASQDASSAQTNLRATRSWNNHGAPTT
jgi:DNA-binding CsgD family transcriptional regulator